MKGVAGGGAMLALVAALGARSGCGFAPPPRTGRFHSFAGRHPSDDDARQTKRGMFTGIVEEMGEVVSLETRNDMTLWDGSKGKGTEMVIKGDVVMDGAYLGCSISVNGVCLTATELDFEKNEFKVGLAPETLRRTNLGSYTPSTEQRVNLERASEIGGRNSGHFVQGHVDNVGTIIDRWTDDNSLFFKISFPEEYMRYIVPKGFIAIDGTSLTVCDVNLEENWFTLMLVEYTQKKIILPSKSVGGTVNVEVDVLSKYSKQAWDMFMPKMEALEQKVRELEQKVEELESSNTKGGESSVVSINIENGLKSSPETWDRSKQAFSNGDVTNPDCSQSRGNGGTTAWVRSKQTFYDTNY